MTRPQFRTTILTSAAALAALGGAALAQQSGELDVPALAETEPVIAFPTCVGLARIESGAVTPIPVREGEIWDEAFDNLGAAVGRTVAVLDTDTGAPAQLIADLRADADENGLDYLVVYEIAFDAIEGEGPKALDRLDFFPAFEGENPDLPSRAAGTAVLLDIRDGALYGLGSAATIDNELENAEALEGGDGMTGLAYRAVTTELAHEVETAFVGIMIKAGMPAPEPEYDGEPEDMTEEQRIAMADRAFAESFGEAAPDTPGC